MVVYRINKPSILVALRQRPLSHVSGPILVALGIYYASFAIPRFSAAEMEWLRCVMAGILLILGAYFIYADLRRARQRMRLIVTEKTLAIQGAGERAQFVRRDDCTALADGGRTLVLLDGTKIPIWVDSASASANEGFLKRFYTLWWPGLELSDVQEHLRRSRRVWPALLLATPWIVFFLLMHFASVVAFHSEMLWAGILVCVGLFPIIYYWLFVYRYFLQSRATHRYELASAPVPAAEAPTSAGAIQ